MISGGFGRWYCGLLGLCLLHVVGLILVLFCIWVVFCKNGGLWVMVVC